MDPQPRTDSGRPPEASGGDRLRDAWEDGPEPQRPPADAFKEIGERFAELKEYAAYYVAAKADGIKASFRNLGIFAALGVVGLLAGGAVIVTAGVLLLTGLAGAIGAIFDPDLPWVGNLVVGAVVLGGLAAATILFLRKMTAASRERTVKKYESRQQHQRVQFGHDVHERARQAEREA